MKIEKIKAKKIFALKSHRKWKMCSQDLTEIS